MREENIYFAISKQNTAARSIRLTESSIEEKSFAINK